jgi:hypothetical protein
MKSGGSTCDVRCSTFDGMDKELHLIEEDLKWWVEREHRKLLAEIKKLLSKYTEFHRLYPE